eukprot:8094334-Ditylum_brightwellii.AAC.1
MERPVMRRAGRDSGYRMRLVLWAFKASKSFQLKMEPMEMPVARSTKAGGPDNLDGSLTLHLISENERK